MYFRFQETGWETTTLLDPLKRSNLNHWTNFKVKVKVTLQLTVSQSVSCRAPSGDHDQIFVTVWQLRSCFLWGTLSEERTGLSLYMLLDLASAVFLGSESFGTRYHILLSQIWDFPFRRLLRLAGLDELPNPPQLQLLGMDPCRKHRSLLYSNRFRGNVFVCERLYSVTPTYTCLLKTCSLEADICYFVSIFLTQ
jgi:hypothetical protein